VRIFLNQAGYSIFWEAGVVDSGNKATETGRFADLHMWFRVDTAGCAGKS
jgi:hypothetical protein